MSDPRARPAVRLLAALVLLAAPPVHANVTGHVEIQSQTTQTPSPLGGTTRSTLLVESLSLHYAGMPFGSSVAIATAGGAFSNVTGWLGNGLRTGGRILSFDTSVGLLPRRAVPLRLYASGSVDAGRSGALATTGAGPSFLYGGALNLEPGTFLAFLPGLRVDAAEGRSSRPGHPDGSDVQRRLVASSFGTVAGQRLDLGVRLESDHRDAAGDLASRAATLRVSAASHQTSFFASEVRRSFPTLTGITSDRLASGTSDQRWGAAFTTQLAARLSEASVAGARGTLGDARAAFTWLPIRSRHQLALSGGANAGFSRTSSAGAEGSGDSLGYGGRAGYTRPLGPVTAGVGLGASASRCDCGFGNAGTTTLVDATASVALLPAARGSAQAEATLARAAAPLGRGGDRLEGHARATGRLPLGAASSVNAGLAYDDGVRELLDITSGRAASLHERAVTGSLGAATRLGGLSLSAEGRQTRGRVVSDGSPFVAGSRGQISSITSAQASAAWSPRRDLGVRGQLTGTWTALADAPGVTALGGNFALDWRLGRIVFGLQYHVLSVELGDARPSLQHTLRTVASRPFEL